MTHGFLNFYFLIINCTQFPKLHEKNIVTRFYYYIFSIRVFICICPRHCEQNSCHNVKTFLFPSGFRAKIVTNMWRVKVKICSMFASEFFVKFWTFVWSIQSSFLFSIQKYIFFWNWTKIDTFSGWFLMELFFGGGIPLECKEFVRTFPSSFGLVPHNVSGIPATLWLTMWTECEEFVSLNEDAYWHQ